MSDNKAQIERFSPGHLHNKPHFTNLVTSEGGKTIHLSGLVASDAEGEPPCSRCGRRRRS